MAESMPDNLPRNCGACHHFDTEFERGYYGDSSTYAKCSLGKWSVTLEWGTAGELQFNMRSAAKCPEFLLVQFKGDDKSESGNNGGTNQ